MEYRKAATSMRSVKIGFARGLLFIGAETGVYYSSDDGAHWQSL
jgi:hypothetical protein